MPVDILVCDSQDFANRKNNQTTFEYIIATEGQKYMDKSNNDFSWFEYAENDFEAATILSAQLKPKYEIVCYHCQQCAEKVLKGYIASNNGRLLKTHDLEVLCQTSANYDPDFENIIE